MSTGDITGATAVYMLSVPGVFPTPVQLQGFAADDVFTTNPLESAETAMGVDGFLSGGFVFAPLEQEIMLQADSDSNAVFDSWWSFNQQNRLATPATGIVTMKAILTKWNMTRGFLIRYTPMPAVKKLLQPRRFAIRWQSVSPALAQ